MRTEVYSWRLSANLKSDLEREALPKKARVAKAHIMHYTVVHENRSLQLASIGRTQVGPGAGSASPQGAGFVGARDGCPGLAEEGRGGCFGRRGAAQTSQRRRGLLRSFRQRQFTSRRDGARRSPRTAEAAPWPLMGLSTRARFSGCSTPE